MKSLEEHLTEFKRDGFTLFPRMLDPAWMREMRDGFEELEARTPNADGSRPSAITDLLEHKPEPVLRALSNARLLDFAEMVVGPHVQLESITFRRTPPQPEQDGAALGFHRDMFAFFPEDGVYHRPLLFNALSYLQDLTDETGPLRIIPGSHMRAMRMSPGGGTAPAPRGGDPLPAGRRHRRVPLQHAPLREPQPLQRLPLPVLPHLQPLVAQAPRQLPGPGLAGGDRRGAGAQ